MPERSSRGPYAVSDQRRRAIADAVLAIVDEDGHGRVTTARVASRSGIAEATVLYHFPTKGHMLVGALERADEIDVALSVPDESHASLDLDFLREMVNARPRADEPRARLREMLRGQAATDGHPAAAYFAGRDARAVRIFTGIVARRRGEGLAHADVDPGVAALQILALWEGISTFVARVEGDRDVGALLVDGIRRLTGADRITETTDPTRTDGAA